MEKKKAAVLFSRQNRAATAQDSLCKREPGTRLRGSSGLELLAALQWPGATSLLFQ
jgi:hypothetical protein